MFARHGLTTRAALLAVALTVLEAAASVPAATQQPRFARGLSIALPTPPR